MSATIHVIECLMVIFKLCYSIKAHFIFPFTERPVTDVDVVFALGASGHHGDEMFEKEKEFVNGFIDSSKYGDMNYAMIQYSDPLTVHFR